MSIYVIDFSEPLATGFDVLPGSYNGPGMASPQTSLRLYGRGAVEWGEGVNEDLVRLVENFASATPPPNPINGQLWAETKLYHLDGATYYRFDPDVPAGPWVAITVATSEPVSPTEGTYYTTGGKLYGYYTQKPNTTPEWIERSFSTGTLNLVDDKPEVVIKAYNAFTGEWTQPLPVIVATTADAPTTPATGTMWYDTLAETLYVFDGTNWLPVITGTTGTGDIEVGANQVNFSNMFLNEGNGDTTTGADIRFNEAGLLTSAANLHIIVDNDNNTTGNFVVSKGSLTTTGDVELLTVYNNGEVRANTANYETLVLNTNSLTNKKYVDDSIAAVTGSIPSVSTLAQVFTVGTSTTYKAGDIAVIGGVIYIAVAPGTNTIPSADWKQVFPAQYS